MIEKIVDLENHVRVEVLPPGTEITGRLHIEIFQRIKKLRQDLRPLLQTHRPRNGRFEGSLRQIEHLHLGFIETGLEFADIWIESNEWRYGKEIRRVLTALASREKIGIGLAV